LKLKLVGDRLTGVLPVPVIGTLCGEFGASSVMESVPVRDPAAVGVNVTDMVQLTLDARVFGLKGQLEVCAKSPVAAIDAMVSGAV
jgi:hypothetical protein